MSEALQNYTQQMIPAVEQEMKLILKADEMDDDPFFGMMHYHMGWTDETFNPINHPGGKRVRPLICLLTCQAAGADWQMAIPAAASLEIVHNFTLVHDDVEDASPTRRGRPTVWNIWGISHAVNSGDAMFALAHEALSREIDLGVPAEIVVKALRRLDQMCVELTKGQYADLIFETRAEVTIQEYLAMIGGKTAALLSLSCELGALIAGCDESVVSHYAAFGRDLGLAFQVRDDILGIWGDETAIGKSAATDIVTRKKSLPVIYGLANSEELRLLYDLEIADGDFVSQAVSLLDQANAKTITEDYERDYAQSALGHLVAASPKGPAATALQELTDKLLNRQA
jgi:geranylgeranyl diphosphate synthase type I